MADPLSAAPNAAVIDERTEMRQFPHPGVLRSISWPPFVFAGYTIYCAWFVYFLLVIKGGQASSGASTFWVNLLGVPFELVALLASWYASRSLDLDDKTRHAWRLLAWSYLGSWLVNVGWLYFDSILGGVPLPWWMRVFSSAYGSCCPADGCCPSCCCGPPRNSAVAEAELPLEVLRRSWRPMV